MALKFDKRLKKTDIGENVSQEWNNRLLKLLKVFTHICDKYQLRYIGAYGTCLGAIRHKGMIPWDDDIDVCMPMPDYLMFIEICKNEDLPGCELFEPETTPDLYTNYILLVDKNSSLLFWRRYRGVLGLFIDIFPLSGTSSDMEIAHQMFDRAAVLQKKLLILSSQYSISNLYHFMTSGQKRRVFKYLLYSLNRKHFRKKFLKETYELRQRFNYDNCEYVVNYTPVGGYKLIIPKKWIDETIEVDFDGLRIKIPKEYDKYLTYRYGDYMTPPSLSERDDRHEFDYLNLHQRLSRKEILKLIKKEGR